MAIFAVASVLVVAGIVQLSRVYRFAQSERRVADAAVSTMDRLVREVRLACSIGSISGTSITLATLPNHTGGQNCTTPTPVNRTFALSGGKIIQDGDSAKTLIEANVTVTNTDIFTRVVNATEEMVRIKVSLTNGTGVYQVSRTYYGSAVLRDSY